jgi:hypothetical protein
MGTSLSGDVDTNTEIGRTRHMHGKKMHTFRSQNLKGTDHLDDTGVYGKTSVCF